MMIDQAHSLNMLEIEQHHYESTRANLYKGKLFCRCNKNNKNCEKKREKRKRMILKKNGGA